ncbi:phosphatase PAP2 family protein [Actinomadura atramentaria]|uniref:phosphatase PAP2 family protein n=1 Tax=Actinomadura atramentaria TaxID=1990 RepID=UPI00035D5D26|nr:phosphatase PAP2 family protein [Actinomadura atramentaria]
MRLLSPKPPAPAPVPASRRWIVPGPRPRPVRELILIAVLFTVYKIGRVAADDRVPEAFRNAHDVWRFERDVRLPHENAIQDALLHSVPLIHLADSYYAYVHFPVMGLFLLWTYLRRPAFYRWIRWVVVGLTALALVLHFAVPLAPPRMLATTGLVDTGARFGPAVYGSPQTDTVANQYAAMPSLHIGWAIIIAVGLIAATRTRWRWLWLAHPIATTLVVVGTANHYWLDGIIATLLLTAVLIALEPLRRKAVQETAAPAAPPARDLGEGPAGVIESVPKTQIPRTPRA